MTRAARHRRDADRRAHSRGRLCVNALDRVARLSGEVGFAVRRDRRPRRRRDHLRWRRLARVAAAARHLPARVRHVAAGAETQDAARHRRRTRRRQRGRQLRRRRHRGHRRGHNAAHGARARRARRRTDRRRQRHGRERDRQGVGPQDVSRDHARPRAPRNVRRDVARRHGRRHRLGLRARGDERGARPDSRVGHHRRRRGRHGRRARRERAWRDARRTGYPEQRHAQFHQHGGRRGWSSPSHEPHDGSTQHPAAAPSAPMSISDGPSRWSRRRWASCPAR